MLQPATQEAYNLLHHGSLALANVEAAGIRIDLKQLKKNRKRCRKRIKKLEGSIRESEVYNLQRKRYGKKTSITSGEQVADILFNTMGHTSTEWTKGDKPKSTETNLLSVPLQFVHDWIELEKLHKVEGTFLTNISRETCNGFIHPVFNLHLVTSYRGSSDTPNFQNFPVRNPWMSDLVRGCFVPRAGHQLCEIDFGGVEVCIAACYHQDPRMIEYIKDPTKDMHADMARKIYKLNRKEFGGIGKGESGKLPRYAAKNKFVFPQFYGSYWAQCAPNLWEAVRQLGLQRSDGTCLYKHLAGKGIKTLGTAGKHGVDAGSFMEHVQSVEDWFWGKSQFGIYGQWKKDWWYEFLKTGEFLTKTGFRIGGDMKRNEVINLPVQGSAFHCLLLALILLDKWMRKKKLKSRIVGQIHDSLVLDLHKDERDHVIEKAIHIMTVQVPEIWKWIIVPLKVDVEVAPLGEPWNKKKEIDITPFIRNAA